MFCPLKTYVCKNQKILDLPIKISYKKNGKVFTFMFSFIKENDYAMV
jgi:hypothetical protein